MSDLPIPAALPRSTVEHAVSFFETDAMGIVHHSNYLRYFELARVRWLEEHDQPYTAYMAQDIHFATTRSEVDYIHSAGFGDRLLIATWMQWVRGASLRMDYQIRCGDRLICSGLTEHAAVGPKGRVRRIPAERRQHLRARSADGS